MFLFNGVYWHICLPLPRVANEVLGDCRSPKHVLSSVVVEHPKMFIFRSPHGLTTANSEFRIEARWQCIGGGRTAIHRPASDWVGCDESEDGVRLVRFSVDSLQYCSVLLVSRVPIFTRTLGKSSNLVRVFLRWVETTNQFCVVLWRPFWIFVCGVPSYSMFRVFWEILLCKGRFAQGNNE